MKAQKKMPLWQRLAEAGLVKDRGEAERLILAGKVYLGAERARTAGQPVRPDEAVEVKGLSPYQGKGGFKLTGALQCFGMDVRGRVAIDAGASTGGFTDALLQAGASRVYAVDVGYGQLTGALRSDPRVVNLERTNISDPSLLALSPRPSLGTVDLSYLSLRKGVPVFAQILHGQGELVCLVKPLFEIDDAQARRLGRIEPGQYAPTLEALCRDLSSMGFPTAGVCASPVTGNGGTLEFFLRIPLGGEAQGLPPRALALGIEAAVAQALALTPYRK